MIITSKNLRRSGQAKLREFLICTAMFFWILAGLTWLGGVVSMLTDLLNLSVSYQFDFTILKNNLRFPIIFQRILPQKRLKMILDVVCT